MTKGSTDGKIHAWNTETGVKTGILQGDHAGPVQCVQFNPKYMMLATACSNMVGVTGPHDTRHGSSWYASWVVMVRVTASDHGTCQGLISGDKLTTSYKYRFLVRLPVKCLIQAMYFWSSLLLERLRIQCVHLFHILVKRVS